MKHITVRYHRCSLRPPRRQHFERNTFKTAQKIIIFTSLLAAAQRGRLWEELSGVTATYCPLLSTPTPGPAVGPSDLSKGKLFVTRIVLIRKEDAAALVGFKCGS